MTNINVDDLIELINLLKQLDKNSLYLIESGVRLLIARQKLDEAEIKEVI